MNYNTEFYKEYLEKIDRFKQTSWIKNQIDLEKKPNFWTIIEYGKIGIDNKKSSHETRYSKMLRWLLDANENHNLGNIFASKLIKIVDSNSDYKYILENNKFIKSSNEALARIDIFYKDLSQNVCIAIELKQFTSEHESTGFDSQLDKYENAVEKFIDKKKKDIKPYYIYLTPKKEKPTNDNWKAVGYEEIINIIEEINNKYISNSDSIYRKDTKKVILDFKDDLQRTIDLIDEDNEGRSIKDNFSEEEIAFTNLLSNEITDEIKSNHIDKLRTLYKDNSIDIERIILILSKYIKFQEQDHTPNDAAGLLMRKLFNSMSEDTHLSLDLDKKYSKKDRTGKLKSYYREKYGLEPYEIELTSGKGQGIKLINTIKERQIYFSSDSKGDFPNDYIHISKGKRSEEFRQNGNMENRKFKISNTLLKQDKVAFKNSYEKNGTISLEELLDNYIMKDVKILSDKLKDL